LIEPPLDFLIAAGGDGTIRLALAALAQARSDVPAAIFPLGTGNVFARNIGVISGGLLSNGLDNAYEYLVDSVPMRIDLGMMNGEYFCCFAGVGPVSDAFMKPARIDKTRFKLFAYIKALLASIGRPPRLFKITVDGVSKIVQASAVFFVEVEDLGLNKDNDLNVLSDGYLNMHIINPLTCSDYIALFKRYAHGENDYAPEFLSRIKEARVEALPRPGLRSDFQKLVGKLYKLLTGHEPHDIERVRELPCMIDGDAWGKTPMHVKVIPQAVNVLVPRSKMNHSQEEIKLDIAS